MRLSGGRGCGGRVKYRARGAGRPVEAASWGTWGPRAVHHLPSHQQNPQTPGATASVPNAYTRLLVHQGLYSPQPLREPGNHADRTRCGAYPPCLSRIHWHDDISAAVQLCTDYLCQYASFSWSIARVPACRRSNRGASSQRTGVMNGAAVPSALHSTLPPRRRLPASSTTPALDLERCRTIPSRLVVHSCGAVVPPDPSQLK